MRRRSRCRRRSACAAATGRRGGGRTRTPRAARWPATPNITGSEAPPTLRDVVQADRRAEQRRCPPGARSGSSSPSSLAQRAHGHEHPQRQRHQRRAEQRHQRCRAAARPPPPPADAASARASGGTTTSSANAVTHTPASAADPHEQTESVGMYDQVSLMDSRRLETFQSRRRASSRSAARADALHLSQSAVSQQIAALELDLGGPLFDRSRRRVRLTPAGAALLDRVDGVLAAVSETRRAVAAARGAVEGDLRVAASRTVGTYFLPQPLAALGRRHPSLQLRVTIDNSERVVAALLSRRRRRRLRGGRRRPRRGRRRAAARGRAGGRRARDPSLRADDRDRARRPRRRAADRARGRLGHPPRRRAAPQRRRVRPQPAARGRRALGDRGDQGHRRGRPRRRDPLARDARQGTRSSTR